MLACPNGRLVFQFSIQHTIYCYVDFNGAESANLLPEESGMFAAMRRAFLFDTTPGRSIAMAESPRPTTQGRTTRAAELTFELEAPIYCTTPVFDVTWPQRSHTFPWIGPGWIYQQQEERDGWEPAIGELVISLAGSGEGIIDFDRPLFRRRVKTPEDLL
jgi:hypothetical protein